MYRILLIDDEPIILSGLQSMLKWEDYDCTVAGAARNGEQAWEFIQQHTPDIVICDINMPILTGLELLQRCAGKYPTVVFIMLTNHEDFDMARESLRNHAADYLLKIDLDEQKLAHSIQTAIRECEKRGRLARADTAADGGASLSDVIEKHAASLLDGNEREAETAVAGLIKCGAANHCMAAELIMDPARIPNIAGFSRAEKERLFAFHYKLVEDLAQKIFYGVGCVVMARGGSAWLYLWNLDSFELVTRFQAKLTSTIGEISQMQISVLATEVVSGERVRELRLQLLALRSEFSVSPKGLIQYSQFMVRADYVEAARQYVDSHILERITVQDAAVAIGITPNYLSSLFKRQLGQNFIDYVNATKVKYACTLLRNNQYLVYEVSHMLGYDNAYYFTKVFKRYMKVTPTEYQSLSTRRESPV